MDRTQVCGTCNPGSIPGESTKRKENLPCGRFSRFVKRRHVLPITNGKTVELGQQVLSERSELSNLRQRRYKRCTVPVSKLSETAFLT